MLVGDRMSRPVMTIPLEMPVQDALDLMARERIRHLPVVDNEGELVGVVSEGDLGRFLLSMPTDLSSWREMDDRCKFTVNEIMSREVITCDEEMPLGKAAQILTEHRIGSLAVMREDRIVGILTKSDLLNFLLELLGTYRSGVQLVVSVQDDPDTLSELCRSVFAAGGKLLAFGSTQSDKSGYRELLLKVGGVTPDGVRHVVKPWIEEIIDVSSSEHFEDRLILTKHE
jgi:acetoin utilization protein AcuB